MVHHWRENVILGPDRSVLRRWRGYAPMWCRHFRAYLLHRRI